jgi:hypothetical protein
VLVQLARDPVTQEIDRQAPFLVTDLKFTRAAICKDEPGVLAQIERGALRHSSRPSGMASGTHLGTAFPNPSRRKKEGPHLEAQVRTCLMTPSPAAPVSPAGNGGRLSWIATRREGTARIFLILRVRPALSTGIV